MSPAFVAEFIRLAECGNRYKFYRILHDFLELIIVHG